MTSLHKTANNRRPATPLKPSDTIFGAYFGKDFALPDTAQDEASLYNISSETDRLLKQGQEQLSRLRQAIADTHTEE